jgi:hypothetical protein
MATSPEGLRRINSDAPLLPLIADFGLRRRPTPYHWCGQSVRDNLFGES